TARMYAKTQNAELRRREDLEEKRLAHDSLSEIRERHGSILGRSNGDGPEVLHRKPDLERARVARQLLAIVGEVHFRFTNANVLEVFWMHAERPLERFRIA